MLCDVEIRSKVAVLLGIQQECFLGTAGLNAVWPLEIFDSKPFIFIKNTRQDLPSILNTTTAQKNEIQHLIVFKQAIFSW